MPRTSTTATSTLSTSTGLSTSLTHGATSRALSSSALRWSPTPPRTSGSWPTSELEHITRRVRAWGGAVELRTAREVVTIKPKPRVRTCCSQNPTEQNPNTAFAPVESVQNQQEAISLLESSPKRRSSSKLLSTWEVSSTAVLVGCRSALDQKSKEDEIRRFDHDNRLFDRVVQRLTSQRLDNQVISVRAAQATSPGSDAGAHASTAETCLTTSMTHSCTLRDPVTAPHAHRRTLATSAVDSPFSFFPSFFPFLFSAPLPPRLVLRP